MKQQIKNRQDHLWVAVKVERGFITKAKVYKSLDAANKIVKRWQVRLNPDYDEAAVVKAG